MDARIGIKSSVGYGARSVSKSNVRKNQNIGNRVRFVQAQVKMMAGTNGVVLCIPGADGNDNPGSASLAAYLLQGLSGRALFDILPPKPIDDCVILLGKDEACLWIPKSEEGKQLLLTSHSSLRRSTLSTASSDDTDQSEQEKIEFFIDNVTQFGQVAVAVGTGSGMDIEKWPLVQAFALEQSWLGSDKTTRKQTGFLTMSHKPVGVLQDLHALFSDIDACALEQIVHQNVPQLLYHFDHILSRLDRCSPGQRRRLTELDIAEPVTTYYEFGIIRRRHKKESIAAHRGARVLLGTHTAQHFDPSSDVKVEGSGSAKGDALHFVVEVEDPASGFRVSRTYLLATGCAGFGFEATPGQRDQLNLKYTVADPRSGGQDAGLLAILYRGLVDGLAASITVASSMSRDPALSKACKAAALEALSRRAGDQAREMHYDLGANLEVRVEAMDSCARDVRADAKPDANGLALRRMYFVRLALNSVPSLDHKGAELGALVVGDSFASAVTVGLSTPPPNVPTPPLVLTREFPYFRSWNAHGKEEWALQELQNMLKLSAFTRDVARIGMGIGLPVKATMLLGAEVASSCQGVLDVYSEGFVFLRSGLGPIVVSMARGVISMDLHTLTAGQALVVQLRLPASNVAFQFAQPCTHLALMLPDGSAATREVMNVVKSWRGCVSGKSASKSSQNINMFDASFSLSQAAIREENDRFLEACAIADARRGAQASSQCETEADPAKPNAQVVIVSGTLDSGKELFAHALAASLADAKQEVAVYETDPTSARGLEYDETALQAWLRARCASGGDSWMVVVAPPFADIVAVATTVSKQPGCAITHIVACVNPNQMFVDHQHTQPLPNLLPNIHSGWANTILISNCDRVSQAALIACRKICRTRNPSAEVISAKGGFGSAALQIDQQTLRDVTDNPAFQSSRSRKDRVYSSPGWSQAAAIAPIKPKPAKVSVALRSDLKQAGLRQKLRSLFREAKRFGTVLSARGIFSASPNAKSKTSSNSLHAFWSISSAFHASPAQKAQAGVLHVFGFGLQAAAIKALFPDVVAAPATAAPTPTRASLSREELDKIKRLHLRDPLPAGYYFDGSSFVDSRGRRDRYHPNMDQYIKEYYADKS